MPPEDDSRSERSLPAHLDPRRSPQDKGPRAEARARGRRGRRVATILTRVLAGVLSVAILVGAGIATTAVARINSQSATAAAPADVKGNVQASDVKGADTGEDLNFLVVGNDSREGYSNDQLAELGAGYDPTLNTDTLMLVHVPADGSKASIVSFPRDSFVAIPGYGKGKINSAYGAGYYSLPDSAPAAQKAQAGQAELITTISALTGLKIDHYVEISMLGFFKLTQQLQGVEVTLCDDTSDPQYTGLKLSKGTHLLQGTDALRFVRQRHGLPEGDLDRIKRQQYFFGAVIRKMLDQNFFDLLNLSKLNGLIDALAGTIIYDPGLNPLALAEQMRKIGAGDVEFRTVPLTPAKFGDVPGIGSVVLLQDPATLKEFFRNLNAAVDSSGSSSTSSAAPSAPPTVAPSQVSVDVFNATGTKGIATKTAAELAALGYLINSINTVDQVVAASTISYGSGAEARANTLLALVPGASVVADTGVAAGGVKLVLGSSFTGLGPAAPAAIGTTAPPPPDQTAAAGGCVN